MAEVHDAATAEAFGLHAGDVVVSIHCGSRGLGHQIGTDFLRKMAIAAGRHGLSLPDRELACAPINSPLGQSYLGAMRAAINCALANRQVIAHLTREAFARVFPQARLPLLYHVSHNTCKVEEHVLDGKPRKLFVHRKGATRAFGPDHLDLELPWGGGDGVLGVMREDPQLKTVRVILTTASVASTAHDGPVSLPVIKMLSKPFPLSALLLYAATKDQAGAASSSS